MKKNVPRHNRPRIGVVIPAGGKGSRMGARLPKQFLRLAGVPILQRTVLLFQAVPRVDEIVVVVPGQYVSRTGRLLRRAGCSKVTRVVAGGEKRQHSVWLGLNAFLRKPDIVLVHDAVRPMVHRRVIDAVIRGTVRWRAAVVGVRVKDTIKVEKKKGYYAYTLQRDALWAVQTPQGFEFDLLYRAHREARSRRQIGTDEASLVERLGVPVKIVEGHGQNIKITTPEDLKLVETMLKKAK